MDVAVNTWSMLVGIYGAVYDGGFVAAVICFAVGLGFNSWGLSLTGSPAMIRIHGDTGTIHPEVAGKARGFSGKLVGVLAKLVGAVLVVEGFLAGTMLLFDMK